MTLEIAGARAAVRQCNSYTRLPAVIDLAWKMEARDWLTLLGEEWESCDNISLYLDELLDQTPFADLVEAPLSWRDVMMTDAERAGLQALPETVTVFRGGYDHNKRGLSWSLNKETALRFPLLHRYRSEGAPVLIRATLPREQILALKADRAEDEIIAYRPSVQAISQIVRRAMVPDENGPER